MHKNLVFAAYGWLALSGAMHFVADVLSQYWRGVRAPSAETTLYYGLNSAYSLGQVVFGVLGVWIGLRAMSILDEPAVRILSVVAAFGWLAITLLFMEYWQPKANMAVASALFVVAALTARQ